MTDRSERILAVLRIPLYTGGPAPPLAAEWGDVSLFDALVRTNYAAVRKEFTASDLVPLLKDHPELVIAWIRFSEDKHCGGWWIQGREVGWLPDAGRPFLPRRKTQQFDSLEEAVAQFVVLELDDSESLRTASGGAGF